MPLHAQAPHFFRHFTEKDGLSADNVTALLRDREGYLWVGTTYGLNRYDGHTFRQYLPNSREPEKTVCHEHITALAQDDAGHIWIATRNGLNRYDPRARRFQTWRHTGLDDGSLPNNLITDLLPDGDRIWLACDNRDLVFLDMRTGAFQSFPWKNFAETLPNGAGKSYKSIYGLRRKSATALWLHTNLGLMAFDTQTEKFDAFPTAPKQIGPYRPETDCPETVFVGSWDYDVLCLDPCRRRWSQIRLPLQKALRDGFRKVAQVAQVGTRHWVLSQQGLYYFEAKNGRIHHVAPEKGHTNHVPSGSIQAVFAEPNGIVWFGGEKGLWMLDPALQHVHRLPLDTTSFASYYNRYNRVLDLPEQSRRLVADLYQGQLLVLDRGRWVRTLQLGGQAQILKKDRAGQIWVSGGIQLYQLDPQTLQLTPFPLPLSLFQTTPKSVLVDVAVDGDGRYWFAGSDCGLLIYDPKTRHWEKPGIDQGFIAENLSCLCADPQRQTVWIGSEDYGLFRYDQRTRQFTLYQPEVDNPHSLPAFMVRDICVARDGIVWVATDPGGVSRFDHNAPGDRAFSNINTDNALPSNQVCALSEDAKGRIWAGTTKGLALLDKDHCPMAWDKNSGLPHDYLDLPLSIGADGALYMGGPQGLAYAHPDSLLAQPMDRRLLLNAFKVFDQERTGTFDTAIALPWRDNFFSVAFASAHFSTVPRLRYRAYLEQFDAAPQDLGTQNYRAWTNVPPGRYRLVLSTTNGGTNSAARTLWLTIEPPFWRTWWFRLLALALLGGAVGAAYRYRIGVIRREAALKTEFNRRLAQVEMGALRAQMNPHFVFNCLNSINRFILVNEPEAASDYLTKFSRLIRLILDNSRSETVPLDKELEALRLYIEMEAMRFDGRFTYTISVDPSLQPEHLEVPPLLIQPFVENAIWHGLMHRPTPGHLWVRVQPLGEGFWIQVEDNGVGRARAGELKSKSAQTHKSQGLQLTRERLEVIRTLYGVRADVEIEDLHTPEGAPAGTRVNIRLAST